MPGAPVTAAERRVVRRLRAAGALRPGAADRLEGLRGLQQRRLSHLVARGVVREAAPGSYYLDEEVWDADVSAKRRLAFIMLGIVAVVGLIVFALKGHAQSAPPPANGGWDTARAGVASGTVTELSIEDALYHRSRQVWVYTPASYAASPDVRHRLLVLFDGADYLREIPAPTILDNLHAASAIPPTVAVMVDNAEARLADLANHQQFADFVARELVPWARSHYRVETDPAKTTVGGYSAGGLGAAYVAFRHPEVFGNVLSQSGAFWRGNEGGSTPTEWLTDQFRAAPKLPLRFYVEVGANETGRTAGGPVFIEATHNLRDVLQSKGYALRYVEVPAAIHNPAHWRTQLGDGLIYLSAE